MIGLLRDVLGLLTPRERQRGLLVLFMAMTNAVLEAFTVISVFPFLAVLSRPQVINEYGWLQRLYVAGGFQTHAGFLTALGVAVFGIALVSTAVRMLTEYGTLRYTNMRRHSLSTRLFERYLAQRSAFFLQSNSSEMLTTVLSEVDQLVGVLINPLLALISSLLVTLLLVLVMAFIDWRVVATAVIVLGGGYSLFYMAVQKRLSVLGDKRRQAIHARFREANEAFGGIRDLKLLGLEHVFLRRFEKSSHATAVTQVNFEVLSQLPRNVIQLLAIGGVVLTSTYFVATRGSVGTALPLIGLFAAATYRLMPSLQQLYVSLTTIRFGGAVLHAIQRKAKQLGEGALKPPTADRMPITRNVELRHVTFSYENTTRSAARDLVVNIPVKSAVAFVGASGAGKSTAVDLILGLLEPGSGDLCVDGTPVTDETRRAWQNNVGYVPQHIYLTDDTIAQNIAFGVDVIDREALERAATIAQIHDFIVRELPNGYETVVGERGARLSGGQRQRLGIARALYRNPDLLVFDEATSHLDNATEQAVVEAVASLAGQKTVVIVAHRLTTVRHCERIFVFANGSIVESGDYETLRRTSAEFRRIEAMLDRKESESRDALV
jgi:ATP-binding cassette, subfamily B, bacterial PglK